MEFIDEIGLQTDEVRQDQSTLNEGDANSIRLLSCSYGTRIGHLVFRLPSLTFNDNTELVSEMLTVASCQLSVVSPNRWVMTKAICTIHRGEVESQLRAG